MIYLTGVTNAATCAAVRPDLGLLCTPRGSTNRHRAYYPAWAMDNGCFTEQVKHPIAPWTRGPVLGEPAHLNDAARTIRYSMPHEHRVIDCLSEHDPDGCLFVTLPDVLGDYAATWERSAGWIAHVGRGIESNPGLGWPIGLVMQDGLERDRFVWGSMLNAVEYNGGALFIGGSTDWKLSHAAATLVAEAKDRGLWVHMGRVNSGRRLRYAADIGCDSADGTYLAFNGGERGTRRVLRWLDAIDHQPNIPQPEGEHRMAKRLKPAPPMTTQVVPQGQSSRMAKGREAKRKVEANKAAVDRINARERAAEACDLGRNGTPPSNGTLPPLSTKDRLDLYEKAKKERADANAAALLGKAVPATPSLDELKRRQDMEAKNGKAKKGSTPKVASPRLAKANEARAKAKGKRGRDGETVTDQELLDYIIGVRKAYPDTELVTERRYALFVEGMSFSQGRWASMWMLAEKGTTTAPESKKPKAAAKKDTAKAATAPKGTEVRKPPAKVSGAVKKQTPGAKARENATKAAAEKRQAKKVARSTPKDPAKKATGKAAPKASQSPTARTHSGSTAPTAKATSSAGPSGRDTKMVTPNFKEGVKKSA